MLKNITLSADEVLIRKAREKAESEQTTLNARFREWLQRYASQGNIAGDYDIMMQKLSYAKPMRKYTRDEMNER